MKLTINRSDWVKPGPMGVMLSRLAKLVAMIETRNAEIVLLRGNVETTNSLRTRIHALEDEVISLRSSGGTHGVDAKHIT